jgi:LAO/AO transport system kinase
VLTCSAVTRDGIDDIWQTVLDHRKKFEDSGELTKKRSKQALHWMWALVEEGLIDRFYKNPDVKKSLPNILKSVEKGKTGPTVAAHELLYLHDRCFSGSE